MIAGPHTIVVIGWFLMVTVQIVKPLNKSHIVFNNARKLSYEIEFNAIFFTNNFIQYTSVRSVLNVFIRLINNRILPYQYDTTIK